MLEVTRDLSVVAEDDFDVGTAVEELCGLSGV